MDSNEKEKKFYADMDRITQDLHFVHEALELANRRVRTMMNDLRWLDLTIKGIESVKWKEEDSPKGETIPGVRHR